MIKVSLIEDDRGTIEAFRRLVSGWPGFRCASTHRLASEAIAEIPKIAPDVVLVDLELRNSSLNGAECIRELSGRLPGTPLLAYTQHDGPEFVFPALAAGAFGYVLKGEEESLRQQLVLARDRQVLPSRLVAREIIRYFQKLAMRPDESWNLTASEAEVLRLLAEGLIYKEVAAELGISKSTVNTHVCAIYRKLHVHNRSEAVRKAFPGKS